MDGRPARSYENRLLMILFFTVGFVFFDRLSINFLFPFMREDFALTHSQVGLLTSALAVTWAIFAISMRLPIREFFGWSSALIVLLAVVFAGKGIAALQEAGMIAAHSVAFVRVPALGIYPNAQGLLLQSAVLLLVVAGFAWNHLHAREPAAR